MELTRRDVLAVLAGAGILGGGGAAVLARDGFDDSRGEQGDDADSDSRAGDDSGGDVERLVDALVVTARAVYPGEVENTGAFVESYAATKADRRPTFAAGVTAVLADLDAEARITFEAAYADLDPTEAETVLRRVGAETAEPDPEGTAAERVRYYVVNEVLYALFASPTGGELVGIENPQGHPGGTDSYQRGPR